MRIRHDIISIILLSPVQYQVPLFLLNWICSNHFHSFPSFVATHNIHVLFINAVTTLSIALFQGFKDTYSKVHLLRSYKGSTCWVSSKNKHKMHLSIYPGVQPACRPEGPGLQIFGLITLPLVINYVLLGWAKKLKSSKCWWGQCVLVMGAIFRICGHESQPGLQLVEKLPMPLCIPDKYIA